jgi:hypothetical protein
LKEDAMMEFKKIDMLDEFRPENLLPEVMKWWEAEERAYERRPKIADELNRMWEDAKALAQ